jgi:Ner family transcriptional regulator
MYTTPKPKEPHLLRAWVLYQLALKGITFSSLAKQNGGRRDLPSRAFTQRSPKWEKIIADALLKMPSELWPERYAAEAAKVACGKSTRKSRRMQ